MFDMGIAVVTGLESMRRSRDEAIARACLAPRRSYRRAVIMPISYARGWLGGCCRSGNGCNTAIRDRV